MTDFGILGEWRKRKQVAADVKVENNGLFAHISWIPIVYMSGIYPSRAQAELAELGATPITHHADTEMRFHADFVFQGGKWAVTEVWWRMEVPRGFPTLEKKHSTLSDEQDPVKDWWWALGGQ